MVLLDNYSAGTVILQIILLVKLALGDVCDSIEYRIEQSCCLMCHPGSHVQKHCTVGDRDNTQCDNCTVGTYMDHPNGMTECFKCHICDADLGMEVKRNCSKTRDTVCDCIRDHYCIDLKEEGCGTCKKYKKCVAGEKVKRQGTRVDDVVCEDCPAGTFSDMEMATNCTKWKNCAELGLIGVLSGNMTSDVICEEDPASNHLSYTVATAVTVVILIILLGTVVCCYYKKRPTVKAIICSHCLPGSTVAENEQANARYELATLNVNEQANARYELATLNVNEQANARYELATLNVND
uniref:TNFRSF14 n=1 Tax=Lepidosiren paradoxus TaxID=7883 RepID=A0A6G6CWA3_LEPPA|nr:TNFRSF14 [Lepidosiren paradoxa]